MNDYWRRHARRYDRVTLALNRGFVRMARAVAEAVRDSPDILEVAAGTGLVTAVVAPRAKRYVATDATVEMLELLRSRLSGVPNIEIRPANALSLDFADSCFDAVVMANLLHLLQEPTRALRQARRVLRPRGKLVVPTFSHGQGVLARLVSGLLVLSGFPVVTRFSGRQLDMLVCDAGFEITDARWFTGILPIRFVVARLAGPRDRPCVTRTGPQRM